MCGLFLWFEKKPGSLQAFEKVKLTEALGYKSESRGIDSWGCLVHGDAPLRIHKGIGAFGDRTSKEKLKKDVRRSNWVMGHTRQGTHGKSTMKNCHPFSQGNLIMAHNGVILESKYRKETTLMPEGETDSEAFLSWVVSRKQENLEAFLECNSSWEAFEIFDFRNDGLYIATRGRTLFVMENEKVIVCSSEAIITSSSWELVFGPDSMGDDCSLTETDRCSLYQITTEGLILVKKGNMPPVPQTDGYFYGKGKCQEFEEPMFTREQIKAMIEDSQGNKQFFEGGE